MSNDQVMAKTKTWVLENFDNISLKTPTFPLYKNSLKPIIIKAKRMLELKLKHIYIYIYIYTHKSRVLPNPNTIQEEVRRVPNLDLLDLQYLSLLPSSFLS